MSLIEELGPSLATPTSVLVYDGPPHSDAWFAARSRGITATDMTKIMGASQYGNAVSVWAEKLGRLEDEAGEAAWWGTEVEPIIAKRWTMHTGIHTREIGVLAHVDHPHHRASLDRLNLGCPDGDGPCGTEIKMRSAFVKSKWRDGIPDDVYVQVQWQMWVTGYDHMHLGVLFGGNTPQFLRLNVDHNDIALFRKEADRVWGHVLAETQPEAEPDAVQLKVLDRLYAKREGQVEMTAEHAGALLADLADAAEARTKANAAAKAADARYKRVVALIATELGAAERVYVPDRTEPVFTYRLAERDGYTVKPFTFREMKFDKTALEPADDAGAEVLMFPTPREADQA